MKTTLLAAMACIACAAMLQSPLTGRCAAPDEALTGNAQAVDAKGCARFTVIAPCCVRLEFNESGKFIDEPSYFAVNKDARFKQSKISKSPDGIAIETQFLKLDYKSDGKPFSPSNLKVLVHAANGQSEWTPGKADDANLGGATRTLDGWTGAQKLPDGLLSRNGWHLVDDSRGVLLSDGWVKARPSNAGLDWYLFCYGSDFKAALKALTALGGEVPLPRKRMLGVYYSRYWPYSSQDYRQIVEEYSSHGFPLDVIVMDMDWHKDGWTGYSWNRTLLPDAEELLKWFHSQKLSATLNDHPADGVKPHEDCYASFMKALGEPPESKKEIPFDAADRKYMDAFYEFTHAAHEREGVDFWWLDWQQYQNTKSVPELTNLAWLNQLYYQKAEAGGLRGASLSRWAGWGDHRHPIHFSGDASTRFGMLAFEVPFTAASGNSGCFFWSHDIGGHMGGRNEESYARWCQFGAFSPALRSHSTRSASMDRRPWTYPQWAEDSMRASFRLRSVFFPYTYSSARESCVESIPLIRPMYLDNPNCKAAYRQPQEYLYGGSVLVAPVASEGAGPQRLGRQAVWLPKGSWYNYFSGEKLSGESEVLTASTIDEFPLFVKGGTPIPMRSFVPRVMEPLAELVVRCYPGEDGQQGSFMLYEDDGASLAYKKGAFSETRLAYVRRGEVTTVRISPAKGSYEEQLKRRSYVAELPCTRKASSVFVNGKPAQAEYDEAELTNRVRIPETSIGESVTISLRAPDASQDAIRLAAFAKRAGLPSPAPGESIGGLLSQALEKTQDKSLQEALLAAAGTGAFMKNEKAYGYPDFKKELRLYGAAANAKTERTETKPDLSGDSFKIAKLGNIKASFVVNGKPFEFAFSDGSEMLTEIPGNIARLAKATSSSGSTKGLIDGVAGGYPKDQAEEWASKEEKAGAWVKLEWSSPKTIDKVVLFDRPNLNDHVLEGRLEFSDGSSVPFGELENEAKEGKIVHFQPKQVSWLKVVIGKAGAKTENIGLSELLVFEAGKTEAPASK